MAHSAQSRTPPADQSQAVGQRSQANPSNSGIQGEAKVYEGMIGEVGIVIADNGPGISPKQLDRLCAPLFTTQPVGQGTGWGLSISYQVLVESH